MVDKLLKKQLLLFKDNTGKVMPFPSTLLKYPVLVKQLLDMGYIAQLNSQGYSAYDIAFLDGYIESSEILKRTIKDENMSDENWVKFRLGSYSGYVRESYLQFVINHSKPHHKIFLNKVLNMCNDHIQSIRSAAFQYVTSFIPECDKITLIELLPEIKRLAYVERIEQQRRKFIQDCYFTTFSHFLDTDMIMHLGTDDRLTLYRWYKDTPTAEWRSIVDELYHVESNPHNKEFLFEILVRDTDDPIPLYMMGMKSKFNHIRALALQGYYDIVQDYWPGVEDYVLDCCSRIQDIAIYIMKKHKGVSVGTLLMPLIQPDCSIAVARGMLSWHFSCDKTCARKLLDHLKYYKGKKLAVSIKACSAVLQDEDADVYLKYLDNESKKVSIESKRALSKTHISETKVRAIVDSAKTTWGKQNAEQLIIDQRAREANHPYFYTRDDRED